MGSLGWQETIVIFVLALLLFGPKKLPELGKNLAKAIGEFRRASNELKDTWQREMTAIERETEEIKKETQSAVESTYDYPDSSYDYNYDSSYDYGAYGETQTADAASAGTDATADADPSLTAGDNPPVIEAAEGTIPASGEAPIEAPPGEPAPPESAKAT